MEHRYNAATHIGTIVADMMQEITKLYEANKQINTPPPLAYDDELCNAMMNKEGE